MRNILDITDLKNKKVLLRVDFNVPVSEKGQIEEPFKIERQKETIDYLVNAGAKVLIVSHITAVDTFADLIPQLHTTLGHEVNFVKNIADIQGYFDNYVGPMLLENIRRFTGEKENSGELAEKLTKSFDVYVNDAFAECHRNYASISAVTKLLPSYAGFLIKKETVELEKAIQASQKGKVVIVGGAKAETKVPVVKNFIDKAGLILLGGVVANDVLKEKGQDMGSSIVDGNSKELLVDLDINDPKLLVPEDFIVFDNKILDIGEKTVKKYTDAIKNASMVIWNGPMGLFENPAFATGTQKIAEAIADSNAYKIIGGGDTISAVSKFKIQNSKFNFISTGGGAMLEFLAGEKLPGLEALGYYNQNGQI